MKILNFRFFSVLGALSAVLCLVGCSPQSPSAKSAGGDKKDSPPNELGSKGIFPDDDGDEGNG